MKYVYKYYKFDEKNEFYSLLIENKIFLAYPKGPKHKDDSITISNEEADSIGFLSTSDSFLNTQLWKDFGNHNQGFCIELDYENIISNKNITLEPISYNQNGLSNQVLPNKFHKEKEIRFVNQNILIEEDRYIELPLNTIKRIFLGADSLTNKSTMKSIYDFCKSMITANPKLKIVQLKIKLRNKTEENYYCKKLIPISIDYLNKKMNELQQLKDLKIEIFND